MATFVSNQGDSDLSIGGRIIAVAAIAGCHATPPCYQRKESIAIDRK